MSDPASPGHEGGAADTLAMALTGAVAGVIGVWALDRIDWFMWNRESDDTRQRTIAARPGGEPPAQALVTRVKEATGRDPDPRTHETASQAVHYAIGIVPAIAYAFARDRLPGSGAVRGAAFGTALFVGQDEVLNTLTGLGGKPRDYPWTAHARGLAAHMVYGVATELALGLFDTLRSELDDRRSAAGRRERIEARARD